jgi:hypothetical protein
MTLPFTSMGSSFATFNSPLFLVVTVHHILFTAENVEPALVRHPRNQRFPRRTRSGPGIAEYEKKICFEFHVLPAFSAHWFIYVKIFFYNHNRIILAIVSVTLLNPGI